MSCQTSTRGYQACGHASLSGLTRCLSGTAPPPPQFKMENGEWKMENGKFKMENSPIPPNSKSNIQHSTLAPDGGRCLARHWPKAWQGFLGRRPDSRVRLSDKTNVPGTKWHPLEKESGKTPCDTNSTFNIPHSKLELCNKVSFYYFCSRKEKVD